MYVGSWAIDSLLTFTCNTHATSGAATDADSVPAYRIYEDETGTAILTGTMAKLDDANTVGFYSEQITLSAANGFERGKCYTVYISAAVGGTTGTTERHFQVGADVNVAYSAGATVFASDFTLASATSTTVTLPAADASGNAIPDDDRYEWCVLQVVAGTGVGQVVCLTTAGAGARQYNVLTGTMPVQLDSTSQCVATGSWRSSDGSALIADSILTRNVSNVEATAAEHTLCTVVLAMLEHSISGTTLTIKRTNGTTTHATKTLTTTPASGADVITGVA